MTSLLNRAPTYAGPSKNPYRLRDVHMSGPLYFDSQGFVMSRDLVNRETLMHIADLAIAALSVERA